MIVGLSHRLRTLLVAAGFATVAALAAPAAAQVADDGGDQVEVTEETLRAFAAATLALMDVRTETAARLAAAETEDERARIREKTEREMIRAVERTPDITVPAYNAISQAAREDPAFAAVVDAAILAQAD